MSAISAAREDVELKNIEEWRPSIIALHKADHYLSIKRHSQALQCASFRPNMYRCSDTRVFRDVKPSIVRLVWVVDRRYLETYMLF